MHSNGGSVGMSVSRALLVWTGALYARLASVSGPSLDSRVVRVLPEPFG